MIRRALCAAAVRLMRRSERRGPSGVRRQRRARDPLHKNESVGAVRPSARVVGGAHVTESVVAKSAGTYIAPPHKMPTAAEIQTWWSEGGGCGEPESSREA